MLARIERILDRIEGMLTPPSHDDTPLNDALAFIWQRRDGIARFRPVRHLDTIRLADLRGIDRQLRVLVRNTRQFLRGTPANHVLLWGERGTGKSSAVKALLHEFSRDGLRLVQVRRGDLLDLPEIMDRLWERAEKFILFCDDLSFEDDDAEYKELKAMLEGGLYARPANMLIYATSNRRHLIPERFASRQPAAEEAHPGDAISEQLSLADRFGIRLGFYALDQADYLAIVGHLVAQRGLAVDPDLLERDALRWARAYTGRSGRAARQFVDDLEGRLALGE
ncbi:MAG TPA: ATP-binding protein [Armatimonadota bacterium]|nr:ATP-binding protein [Armatimonadota bacterium]